MNKQKLQKLAKDNKHIPTAEIKQDILDTQIEINQMKTEAEHLEKTPMSMRSA